LPRIIAAERASSDALHDFVKLLAGWSAGLVERPMPFAVRCEGAIQHDGVEVVIQIQATTEPLNEVERAMLSAGHAGAAPLGSRNLLDKDAPERRRHIGTKRGKTPQLER
jgi:hypothetical protein